MKDATRKMTTLSADTTAEAERVQIELFRRAPSWRKMEMASELNQTVRMFALAGLRQRFPRATNPELRRRLADVVLGEELAARVYGKANYDSDVR